jgi:hypothetical protein
VTREVTLIELETIESREREKKITIAPEVAPRNLVTRGMPLNHLVDREFQVGTVRLPGTRLCEACTYLEGWTQQGVLTGLIHRGGSRAEIVQAERFGWKTQLPSERTPETDAEKHSVTERLDLVQHSRASRFAGMLFDHAALTAGTHEAYTSGLIP